MDTFVAALFDSEDDAYRVVEAIRQMEAESDLVVYGGAVLSKDANGEVALKGFEDKKGPRGWATGVIAGGLLGLVAGPAAVAAGVAAAGVGAATLTGVAFGSADGGLFGITSDLLEQGLDSEIVEVVSTEMRPGRVAVVVSVDERSPAPLDKVVKGISGGKIFRQARLDLIDDKLEREAWALQGRDEELDMAFHSADPVERDIISAERHSLRDKVADLRKQIAARQEQLAAEVADRQAALDEQIARGPEAASLFQERKTSLSRTRRSSMLELRAGLVSGPLSSPFLQLEELHSVSTRTSALLGRAFALFMGLCASTAAMAQDAAVSDSAAAAQANNPLADIRAFNIQNYYIGDFTGLDDETGNQFVLRYAQPVTIGNSDWLIRASLPYNSFPTGTGDNVSGVGDFDIFAAYQFETGNPATSFAIGPQIVAPTGNEDVSSDQWQLGLANVYFNANSPKFQYGYLLTYRAGIGEVDDEDDRVGVGALQPFGFYQLGDGWYTGGAPIWTYNFANDNYAVPLGLRVGKVTRRDNTVFNLFAEPQYTVAYEGDGLPEWQVYFGLNMQFLK